MVFLKDVSGNADAGTAQKWGGNQISLIDNLFDNVDISASIVNGTGKVRMATAWYFRSGKLELRNPADTFSYIFIGSAIAANRNITIPLLTGNANMVLDAVTNTFTVPQVIQSSSSGTILELFGTYNTNGNDIELLFRARDSTNATTSYGRIGVNIDDNTDGSEDGTMNFAVSDAGSLTTRMQLNPQGDLELELDDVNSDALFLKRARNTVGDNVKIHFQHHNSINSYHDYAQINSEIVVNTDGAEDGKLEFLTSSGGSLTEKMIVNSNGDVDILAGKLNITRDGNSDALDLYRTDNAQFDNISINFYLQDSGSAKQLYSAITGEINANTAGAEDGVLIFRNTKAGTLRNCATLYMDGYWDLFNYSSTTLDYVGIGFDLNNSSNTRTAYGEIKGEIRTNTAGSEDGRIVMSTRRAGSNIRTQEFRNDGNITCSRNGSTFQFVPRIIDCSGVVVDVLNTGAETTAVSFTIPASTMGTNGSVNLRVLGVLKQNSVTSVNYHFRLKLNGTTVWSDNIGPAMVQSATNAPWFLDIDFANMNSSSSNRLYVLAALNDLSAPSTGEGDITDDEGHALQFGKSFIQSVSTTSDVTMAVTIDMDQTQAASGWEMQYYRAVLYPQ